MAGKQGPLLCEKSKNGKHFKGKCSTEYLDITGKQ
jgi:hypothetical protein